MVVIVLTALIQTQSLSFLLVLILAGVFLRRFLLMMEIVVLSLEHDLDFVVLSYAVKLIIHILIVSIILLLVLLLLMVLIFLLD